MKRLSILALLLAGPGSARAEAVLPHFDPAAFAPGAVIDNPFLPLAEGLRLEFSGEVPGEDGRPIREGNVQTFAGPGPILAGVASIVIQDRSYADGRLIEDTLDYFAQDRDGNVWYLGEDVTNLHYDALGRVESTDAKGSWRAGVNGALAGYAMPAQPKPGQAYQQEHAPADAAMDLAQILRIDAVIDGATGRYVDVLAIYETSSIEPDLREIKYYARGIGLIRADEGLDDQMANPEAVIDLIQIGP